MGEKCSRHTRDAARVLVCLSGPCLRGALSLFPSQPEKKHEKGCLMTAKVLSYTIWLPFLNVSHRRVLSVLWIAFPQANKYVFFLLFWCKWKNALRGKEAVCVITHSASDHLQERLPNDQEQHCRNNRGDPAVHDSAVLRGTFHEAVHDFLSGTYAPKNVLAQHRLCGLWMM